MSQLAGFPLTQLHIVCPAGTDYSALRTIPTLQDLSIFLADLSPLVDLPVTKLGVAGTFADLGPLKSMARLRSLSLSSPELVDLSPLAGKEITDLDFGEDNVKLRDLSPLR